jgi:hypothetical protein
MVAGMHPSAIAKHYKYDVRQSWYSCDESSQAHQQLCWRGNLASNAIYQFSTTMFSMFFQVTATVELLACGAVQLNNIINIIYDNTIL